MELDEIKKIRKQIREMLLNADYLKDSTLKQKKNFEVTKSDCYKELVDLKNDFESTKEITDKSKTVEKIEKLISSLNKLKTELNNNL